MKQKANKTIDGIKKTISTPINGYKALFAMINGDMDSAYKLTHSEAERKPKERRERVAKAKSVMPNVFRCPGCNKQLNDRVRKCTCGMEFK